MGLLERGEDLVEIAAGLIERKAAQAVVAAELNDDDCGMHAQKGRQAGDGVLGGGSAGALIDDLIVIAAMDEDLLQGVRVGLAGIEAVAGGDAVSVADELRLAESTQGKCEKQSSKRND